MKKQLPLILSAIFIVSLLFLFHMEIPPMLATDSGFDTSYDSGGSSGSSYDSGSSWDSSSGSSWDYGSSSSSSGSHGSGTHMSPSEFIIYMSTLIVILIIITFCFMNKKDRVKLILYPFVFILVSVILIPICILIAQINIYFALISITIIFSLPFALTFKIVRMLVDKEPMFKTKGHSITNLANNKIGSFTNREALEIYYREKNNNYVPKTEKNEKVLDKCYEIFREVQRAWMNFDYEKLRTLVTDELYNSYYNQLQTLELKGQKNIMSNFYLMDAELLRLDEENGVWTILVRLEVEFNDYIVDSNNKILRGNNRDKVLMNYLLTFVEDENVENKCPHCGAKLEDGETVCSYCKAHIQALTQTLKLSKKEAISQKPGRKYTK